MDRAIEKYVGDEPTKPTRVLLCGVWDLLHYGHAQAMEKAKRLFPNTCLVIGSM